MSLLQEEKLSWIHQYACRVLRAGPIPRHIAFIMDGNRRYAKKRMQSPIQGHHMGFQKLSQTLQWCRDFGIDTVTVYAFSIENFKRSSTEVDGLMELARSKFQELLDEKEKVIEAQICFRFVGNLALLPPTVRSLVAEIQLFTQDFKKGTVNVCLAYTSQDEMTRALQLIGKAVEEEIIEPDDVSEAVISHCLDTRKSPDPDLLIRTSGEHRLSDFLLWQCSNCCIHFDQVLWPDFSFWNLAYAILQYQRTLPNLVDTKKTCELEASKFTRLLEFIESERTKELIEMKDCILDEHIIPTQSL